MDGLKIRENKTDTARGMNVKRRHSMRIGDVKMSPTCHVGNAGPQKRKEFYFLYFSLISRLGMFSADYSRERRHATFFSLACFRGLHSWKKHARRERET